MGATVKSGKNLATNHSEEQSKRPYEKPTLIARGDVLDLTRGGGIPPFNDCDNTGRIFPSSGGCP